MVAKETSPLDADAKQSGPVYVIDDDPGVRQSLVDLLGAQGFHAHAFERAQSYLECLPTLEPGVVLLDIQLGSVNGLDLLAELGERDCLWPTAIITAHGAIPLAVQAVRQGAYDFLEKPFTASRLSRVVETGIALLPEAAERSRRRRKARALIDGLSERQRQVFEGVVSGLTAKEIALKHSLSHRTVEAYRLDMMAKLGADKTADLFEIKAVLSDRGPSPA